jgi:hypothetical protein
MPNTKNTDTTKTTKTTKTSSTEKVAKTEAKTTTKTSKTVQTKKSEPVVATVNVTEKAQSQDGEKQKKSVRKAGRTILVKTISGNSIDSSVFDSLTGLVSQSETKSSSSYFLTFDNVTNSVNAFRKLRTDSTDYKVKFSYYRVFFTVNGLTDSSDYNQVKQDIVTWVGDKTKSSVLYCKLYRKDNKYLGCGDFTIDTIDGMNTLLAKEGGLKEFTIGQLSGTFYRYNGKKDKSEQAETADA